MSDIGTQPGQGTAAGAGQNTGQQPGGGAPGAGNAGTPTQQTDDKKQQSQQVTFTAEQQAHIDALISSKIGEERAKADRRVEDAKSSTKEELERQRVQAERDAEAQRMKEQGKWEEVAKNMEATNAALQARIREQDAAIAAREAESLRLRVAQRHSLPEGWHVRLVGETEQELDQDAAKMAEQLKPPTAPNFELNRGNQQRHTGIHNSGQNGGTPPPGKKLTPDDEKELAGRRKTGSYKV